MSDLSSSKNRPRQSGQVIIEYVLLLVVALGLAAIVVSQVSGNRDGSEPGFLKVIWKGLGEQIGADNPNK